MRTILENLDDLPEALHKEYEEKDGKFYLKLEGDEPNGYVKASLLADANGRLVEFRENNRGLAAEKTELTAKLAALNGLDPEEHKRMKVRIAELEKKGVKGADDLGVKIQEAVTAAVNPLQQQLTDITKREQDAQTKLLQRDLENTLTKAGISAGVEEKAIPDYLRRGMEVFSLEDGKPVAKNGTTPIYSTANPDQPLSVGEWATGLVKEAPHLFKPTKGGGADGGPGGPLRGATISRDSFGDNLEAIAKGKVTVAEG
jgi:hypothetical protein